jgi:hypothetical protein
MSSGRSSRCARPSWEAFDLVWWTAVRRFQDAEVATFRAIGQQVGLLLLARTADVPPTLDTPGSSPSPPG